MLSFALFVLLLVGLSDLADLATAKRLAGEGYHFLMLQHDGQVFAVGYNNNGQLGLSTTTNALLPQAMLSVTNASDVSAGIQHSCLIDQGSIVKCTGNNFYYQLGDGTNTEKHMLVPALDLDSGIEELYCGYVGSCARMTSGKAQCWGYFANAVRSSPVNITIPGGIQSMSLGNGHDCIVEVGGKLYCMGSNSNGQLGTGTVGDQAAPIQVVGLAAENIVSVACGWEHTCAVNAAGAMFCWGESDNGRLGNPTVTSDSPNPVQVTGITSGAASAWTGWYNSFALMQNGTVWAFGKDVYGLFGTGSAASQPVPIVFGQGVSGVVELRGGYLTTCVLLQNDRVWCTGDNRYGELGVGNTTNFQTLVEMQLPSLAPTAEPTLVPTIEPTVAPTQEPTLDPTLEPTLETAEPTVQPTVTPTVEPTQDPTLEPTLAPTSVPTFEPTLAPTSEPTLVPTSEPTFEPTVQPTMAPTVEPTQEPTLDPTLAPSAEPTLVPTAEPTQVPTLVPTIEPTAEPTLVPTSEPTFEPTQEPSLIPTSEPTVEPTQVPTLVPTADPTAEPTLAPTSEPTFEPTVQPTMAPTVEPTQEPTLVPTADPTLAPASEPTQEPTLVPTAEPTQAPTLAPTSEPIAGSTAEPTAEPTLVPTVAPTFEPTLVPTAELTLVPTSEPTLAPTLVPTAAPAQGSTTGPTAEPTLVPTSEPTSEPTVEPTLVPTNEPTAEPAATVVPTNEPTVEPTSEPAATVVPTSEPTTMPTPEPIQSPVEPPTVPANPICLPVIGTDKAECATLMKTCAKSNVAMFWAGAGCRVNGILQQDGGCQCRGYCGYTCAKACNLSSGGRCKWNNNLKACTVAATGKAYVPRDSKYCPRD
ncbi:hypothetical protein BASA81_003931 [Batrachochytrium salamandrivorans]|nr:hypothetical protein BASA81_003931 [Batrachochytrium salamandrivorans]